jgi:predicted phosphodiesterase
MRAIVISDIHGNVDVLRALELEWGQRLASFDRIVCLGDLVDYGPDPADVIDWVRARATDVVRGNHDHAMATGESCGSSPAFLEASVLTRERLRPALADDEIQYLRELPLGKTLTLGTWTAHLVHAAPVNPIYAYVPPDAPDERWLSALDRFAGRAVLVGHTHVPFERRVGGGVVINPGSLGMPKDGNPDGSYAVIEDGVVQFRRVRYDPEPTIARLQQLDLPERVLNQLVQTLRTGT